MSRSPGFGKRSRATGPGSAQAQRRFVLRQERGAAPLGLLVCVGICASFFVATAFFEDMGSRPGGLDPRVAAWAANVVFGVVGVAGLARARV